MASVLIRRQAALESNQTQAVKIMIELDLRMCLQECLKHRSDCNIVSFFWGQHKYNVLHLAAFYDRSQMIVDLLREVESKYSRRVSTRLANDLETETRSSPLAIAIFRRSQSAAHALLTQRFADIDTTVIQAKDGRCAMYLAIEFNCPLVMSCLASKDPLLLQRTLSNSSSALNLSLKAQHKELILSLLDARASVERPDVSNGFSALMYAVQLNDYYIISRILERGGTTFLHRNLDGKTAIQLSLEWKHLQAFDALLQYMKCSDLFVAGPIPWVDQLVTDDCNCLHLATIHDWSAGIDLLVRTYGANIYIPILGTQQTAIQLAQQRGLKNALRTLEAFII